MAIAEQKYIKLHNSAISSLTERGNMCDKGYSHLLRADTPEKLAAVVRLYWPELNREKFWLDFQPLLQKYYQEQKEVFHKYRIYYNEDAADGFCIVDGNADKPVMLSGQTRAVVHDNASVAASQGTHVTAFDQAEVMASGMSHINAYHYATVYASGQTTVRLSDTSHCIADGSVTVYMSDHTTIENKRAYRIYYPTKS